MEELSVTDIQCPFCGELFPVTLDPSGGPRETWTTDCEICCHPIRVDVEWRKGRPRVSVERDE